MTILRRIALLLSAVAITACHDEPTALAPKAAPGRPNALLISGPGYPYTRLAVGLDHDCALRSDGVVECWGLNDSLQAPGTRTAGSGSFTQLTAGAYHTCALRTDGVVECWGASAYGQAPATKSAATGTFTQVSAFYNFTCALRSDGKVECWGLNAYGGNAPPLTSASNGGTFTQVSAGGDHTCALRSDGKIECWGINTAGQAPLLWQATGGSSFTQVSAGAEHTCALRADRGVECVGSTFYAATQVPDSLAGTSFVQVSAGGRSTCALRADGVVKCWGSNSDGQSPATRTALSGNFTQVKPHTYHACALRSDGVVECWGNVLYNQSPVTRGSQAPPYTTHVYPTATFTPSPGPVSAGTAFTLTLSGAQVPGWAGPVTFTYAFDCGAGYGGFFASNTVSCPTSAAGTRSVRGKVMDQSGDVTEYTATVVVSATDVTPPTITPNVVGTMTGGSGWYRSDVSVTWTVTDLESVIVSQVGCVPTTITTDTTEQALSCQATSAGGLGSANLLIHRDATPPVVLRNPAADVCSVPGSNGWCRGTQSAGFTASDALSGMNNPNETSFTRQTSADGAAVAISSGTIYDVALNPATLTAGPFKIDHTAPTVGVTGVAQGATYQAGSVPAAACTTTDAVSGVATNATLGTSGGPTGSVTATCSGAIDNAGNATAPVSVTYTITGTSPVLGIDAAGQLDKRTDQGLITGTASCAPATTLTITVSLSQAQTKGKTTTTVTGSASATFACSGTTPWSVAVTASAPTGSKFAAGAVTATASAPGAGPATQTVQLK